MSVVLTQLIWLHDGQAATFAEFEDSVLPMMARHGGELLLRERPPPGSLSGTGIAPPDEIHVVRFASEEGLQRYQEDPERTRLLPLKERSVRATLVVRGPHFPR